MSKKHIKGIEQRKSRTGFLFILPWVIGITIFFIIPIIQSFIFSLSKVSLTNDGIKTEFVFLENYIYIIRRDPNYLGILRKAVFSFMYSLPLIMIISMVLALVLNQHFKGRVVFRALFFLPVIIASGVVMDIIFSTTASTSTAMGVSDSITANMFSVEDIISKLNMPVKVATYIQTVVSSIFDLIWSSGIQIVLFISGLQSIPTSIYEASKVEGATKWEEFWFITFPQLSRITLLVAIFTMIELFTDKRNAMIKGAYTMMSSAIYDEPSAMLWFFFAIIGLIMAVVVGLYSKILLKRWE